MIINESSSSATETIADDSLEHASDHDDIAIEISAESPETLEDTGPVLLSPHPDPRLATQEALPSPGFSTQSMMPTLQALLTAAAPFCASRLAVSLQGIGYAYLMGQLGHLAISAGPLISGMQNAVVTPLRTGLGAINVLVPSMQEPRIIGRLVQQTYASTILLTLPTLAILCNAGAILNAIGTDAAVAATVQDYMNGYSWGILPIYALVIDQQFALAIGKRRLATIIGFSYATLVLAAGYVFTSHVPGYLYHNTYSLGLGFSVSAWFMVLSLKLFFILHQDYQAYQLFNFLGFFENIKHHFKKMAAIAIPMWLQSLSESFNLMAISMLMSRISNDALMAEQVSLQWMTAFSPVILAIANVTCSISSRLYGMLIRQVQQNNNETGHQIIRQLGRQTAASMLMASTVGIIFASLFLTIPRSLTSLFVPVGEMTQTQYQTVESLSTLMLQTNSLGMMADSLRITLTGNLLGMRDAIISASVSFLLISVLGLLIGTLGTELFGFGADSLFIVRNLFVIVATLAITGRWFIYRDILEAPLSHQDNTHSVLSNRETIQPRLPSHMSTQVTQYGSFFRGLTQESANDRELAPRPQTIRNIAC